MIAPNILVLHENLALPSRLNRPRTQIAAIAIAAALLGGVALPADAAEKGPWVQLKGEQAALSLDDTIFAGKRTDSIAFRHQIDGRSDWIQSGTLAMPEPNVTIVVTRRDDPQTFRYSIVKNLEDFAELKAVEKGFKAEYYEMTTWMGLLRGVLFEVNADGVLKHCVGFHKPGTSKVNIRGYLCFPDVAAAAPQQVACLIDKLRFVRPSDDAIVKTALGTEHTGECSAKKLEPGSRPAVDASKESL